MENTKPLKVLQVVGVMNRAGTETMLMNIYRNIDREKIQFDFISYSEEEGDYDQEIRQLGGRVIKLKKTNSIKQLYQAMKRYGPYDVVHSHTLFHCGIANFAAFLVGTKIRIAHAHTTADRDHTVVRKIYIGLMRKIIHLFSTHLLACSNKAGSYLFGPKKVTSSNYTFFPNLIDYSLFIQKPEMKVKRFKMNQGLGNNLVIGHIGRFIEAKNHRFLLEIMQTIQDRYPSLKLVLVGDGDLRQQIEQEANQLGVTSNVKFVGVRSDIATVLHSLDVFVFPSTYEGLGLVLLEAQACGVPCLVSEAIQPEADLEINLVSKMSLSDGPEAWSDKIIDLIRQEKKDSTAIAEVFDKRGYSLTKGMDRLMKIYQSSEGGSYEKGISSLL